MKLDIQDLKDRVEVLEGTTIASINSQISAIHTSIADLIEMDKFLGEYINDLEITSADLQKQISAIYDEIEKVRTEHSNDNHVIEQELINELNVAKEALEKELSVINSTILKLQSADSACDKAIAELHEYVDKKLVAMSDWASATFSTLEQYEQTQAEVAAIRVMIEALEEELTVAFSTNLSNSISELEDSMKQWVNENLTGYYSIAYIDVQLNLLNDAIDDNNASHRDDVEALSLKIETMRSDIISSYASAISDAIFNNNGVINAKIAAEISSINERIDCEIDAIKMKIQGIENRLDGMSSQISELMSRIQSISYIPRYDDGKATVEFYSKTSRVEFDFELSPKETIQDLSEMWDQVLNVKAIYTQTRSISLIDMQILTFACDSDKGIITITVSGENLSDDFFAGNQTASARLAITDGNISVTSDYIPMIAESVTSDKLGIVPNNEIWYTTLDGEVQHFAEEVEFYDEDDNSVSVSNFGANIVSNTYKNGKGVVVFDGDVTKVTKVISSSLASIRLPDSVVEICNEAFSHYYTNPALLSVTLGNGLEYIGDRAFASCDFSSITLPSGLKYIGDSAFYNCDNLKEITLPESVDFIGECVFFSCESLKTLKGKFAINGGKALVANNTLIHVVPDAELTYFNVPEGVTIIGRNVFRSDFPRLSTVSIPESLTRVHDSAFYMCESLTAISLPESLVYIGDYAFCHCAFTNIELPDNLTYIGDSAFSCCRNLLNITIPGVGFLGNDTFYDCTSLVNVIIQEGVKEIGGSAFQGCKSLKSVTLPGSIKNIGVFDSSPVFDGCTSLSTILCKALVPPGIYSGDGFYLGGSVGMSIFVPSESLQKYKTSYVWANYADKIYGYSF